jgi:hypothetical protein
MASTQTLWAIRKAPPLYSLSKVATVTSDVVELLLATVKRFFYPLDEHIFNLLLPPSTKQKSDGERDALDGHEFLINHYANVLAGLPQCQLFLNLNSNAGSGRSR